MSSLKQLKEQKKLIGEVKKLQASYNEGAAELEGFKISKDIGGLGASVRTRIDSSINLNIQIEDTEGKVINLNMSAVTDLSEFLNSVIIADKGL